jgi:hypothetical protein
VKGVEVYQHYRPHVYWQSCEPITPFTKSPGQAKSITRKATIMPKAPLP